ncbi:MAG TPA: hypothetical protein VLS94_05200 [Fusibacter sp.]|nr:hypothetical protein [Fusibacter sp.]
MSPMMNDDDDDGSNNNAIIVGRFDRIITGITSTKRLLTHPVV